MTVFITISYPSITHIAVSFAFISLPPLNCMPRVSGVEAMLWRFLSRMNGARNEVERAAQTRRPTAPLPGFKQHLESLVLISRREWWYTSPPLHPFPHRLAIWKLQRRYACWSSSWIGLHGFLKMLVFLSARWRRRQPGDQPTQWRGLFCVRSGFSLVKPFSPCLCSLVKKEEVLLTYKEQIWAFSRIIGCAVNRMWWECYWCSYWRVTKDFVFRLSTT